MSGSGNIIVIMRAAHHHIPPQARLNTNNTERPGVSTKTDGGGVYHDYPESVSSRKHLLRKIDKSVNVIQECANIKKFYSR